MKYTVKSPLNHDNKFYEIGKQVELTDEAAAPLLACGCVEAPAAQIDPPPPPPPLEPESAEILAAADPEKTADAEPSRKGKKKAD